MGAPPLAGSTASEADVKKGDVIAAIDGVPMAGKTSFEGAEQLQARGGVKGSYICMYIHIYICIIHMYNTHTHTHTHTHRRGGLRALRSRSRWFASQTTTGTYQHTHSSFPSLLLYIFYYFSSTNLLEKN